MQCRQPQDRKGDGKIMEIIVRTDFIQDRKYQPYAIYTNISLDTKLDIIFKKADDSSYFHYKSRYMLTNDFVSELYKSSQYYDIKPYKAPYIMYINVNAKNGNIRDSDLMGRFEKTFDIYKKHPVLFMVHRIRNSDECEMSAVMSALNIYGSYYDIRDAGAEEYTESFKENFADVFSTKQQVNMFIQTFV